MSRRRAAGTLLFIGLVLLALNLRSPIVAVSGVLGTVIDDLGLSVSTAGLLTSLPVLAFAILTPIAARVLPLLGADLGVCVTLVGLLVGTVVRSSGGTAALLVGTAVIGLSITLGNLVVPMLVHRDHPPERRALVMGVYTVALNVGTVSTLVATAPLAEEFGWRVALLAGVAPILLSGCAWVVAVGWRRAWTPRRQHPASLSSDVGGMSSPADRRTRTPWRIWTLAVAFGAQAFLYYAITAWLPEMLAGTHEMTASGSAAAASLFQVFAIVGGLGVPLLVRVLPYWVTTALLACFWIAVPVGLLLFPDLWSVWLSLGGVAQGGFFTLVFIVVVQIAPTALAVARSSAVVQCVGYAFGALGPSAIGVVLAWSGGWTAPLLMLCGASAVLAIGGVWAVVGIRGAIRDVRDGQAGEDGSRSKVLTNAI